MLSNVRCRVIKASDMIGQLRRFLVGTLSLVGQHSDGVCSSASELTWECWSCSLFVWQGQWLKTWMLHCGREGSQCVSKWFLQPCLTFQTSSCHQQQPFHKLPPKEQVLESGECNQPPVHRLVQWILLTCPLMFLQCQSLQLQQLKVRSTTELFSFHLSSTVNSLAAWFSCEWNKVFATAVILV